MIDRDSDGESLVVRRSAPLDRADRFRERLDESKLRLREAVDLVKDSARQMTPAAQIGSNPVPWVLGGFALGLALGWLTAPPRALD